MQSQINPRGGSRDADALPSITLTPGNRTHVVDAAVAWKATTRDNAATIFVRMVAAPVADPSDLSTAAGVFGGLTLKVRY